MCGNIDCGRPDYFRFTKPMIFLVEDNEGGTGRDVVTRICVFSIQTTNAINIINDGVAMRSVASYGLI